MTDWKTIPIGFCTTRI